MNAVVESTPSAVQPSLRLQGIGEYYFSAKLREIEQLNNAGKSILNLGIGSPDLPPHPNVIATLQKAAADPANHAYQGYKGIPALRQAMAQWYQEKYQVALDPEKEILPLIGSKEGIMHICMTYLNQGDAALIPDPGYPTYASAVRLSGGLPLTYDLTEEKNWLPTIEELSKTIHQFNESHQASGKRVKLLWLNYPHMPTGAPGNEAFFIELLALAEREGILLCHDNPYSFILNNNPSSLLRLPGAKKVAIELNSLSKSHNMAGWRVGILAGSADRIQEVLTFKSNMDSGMFKPMQLAAVEALRLELSWHHQLNDVYQKRQLLVFKIMDLLGCKYQTNQVGMFVWAAIPTTYTDGYQLSDAVLNQANVFITPGGIFGKNGLKYIRISLCSKEEVFVQALERISSAIDAKALEI